MASEDEGRKHLPFFPRVLSHSICVAIRRSITRRCLLLLTWESALWFTWWLVKHSTGIYSNCKYTLLGFTGFAHKRCILYSTRNLVSEHFLCVLGHILCEPFPMPCLVHPRTWLALLLPEHCWLMFNLSLLNCKLNGILVALKKISCLHIETIKLNCLLWSCLQRYNFPFMLQTFRFQWVLYKDRYSLLLFSSVFLAVHTIFNRQVNWKHH